MTYEDLIKEMCHGERHMFIHAAAGHGKSHAILKMQELVNDCLYTSPTGIAALHINGETLHSMFSLKNSIQLMEDTINAPHKRQLIKNARPLLIDEVGMLRCDCFDAVDRRLKIARDCDEPFGGMRIILVGDLFQLGQITKTYETEHMRALYPCADNDFSFYNSKIFLTAGFYDNLDIYELCHNFRQEHDEVFRNILSCLRFGEADDDMVEYVNRECAKHIKKPFHFLTVTNKNADVINSYELGMLPDEPHLSIQDVDPFYMMNDAIVRGCPLNRPLLVKNGMQVMFALNDSQKNGKRWVNGTLGMVVKKNTGVNKEIDSVIVNVNGMEYEVFKETVEVLRTVFDENEGKLANKRIAVIRQFPFKPSWANTICKSQGLTLERIMLDFEKKVFYHGGVYVAFSRPRYLCDICLTRKLTKDDLNVSKKTKNFYKTILPLVKKVTQK
jgi:ATP-dependent exoDNAse (exonuclease V) alpha subunit